MQGWCGCTYEKKEFIKSFGISICAATIAPSMLISKSKIEKFFNIKDIDITKAIKYKTRKIFIEQLNLNFFNIMLIGLIIFLILILIFILIIALIVWLTTDACFFNAFWGTAFFLWLQSPVIAFLIYLLIKWIFKWNLQKNNF